MTRRDRNIEPVRVTRGALAAHLAEHCPVHRIDLAGVVGLPCRLPHESRWHDWITGGRHGDLAYLTRDPAGRADPTLKNSWAKSLLIFAQRYTAGWPAGDPAPVSGGPCGNPDDPPWTDRVARYARGLDYHDVLLRDIKGVVQGLQKAIPGLEAFPATDTGPYLEREYSWLAGLGFMGKNTCLIHEKLGSGMFLGVALTNLDVEDLASGEPAAEPLYAVTPRRRRPPHRVAASHCGSCTRCIEACPTGAIAPDGGLDAGSCISTWSIEWRGRTPAGRSREQGGLLFGCDICQAVCPWNRKVEQDGIPEVRDAYAPLPEHAELKLADLVEMSDDEFRRRFRRSAIWRCHPQGLRSNAEVVRANIDQGGPS